jgi:hypothetical protein
MWTSNQAKLAPKPHQYVVLHPSALLPFAFFLLSSCRLLIAYPVTFARLFAARDFATFATCAVAVNYSFALLSI